MAYREVILFCASLVITACHLSYPTVDYSFLRYTMNVAFVNLLFLHFCREEIEKQRAHERYMRLQEQGKTEQARKDLGELHYIFLSKPTLVPFLKGILFKFVSNLFLFNGEKADSVKLELFNRGTVGGTPLFGVMILMLMNGTRF